ncbi:response regulator transcription factor [bacterium]|nr:response regulator transcription factor [bacterium]
MQCVIIDDEAGAIEVLARYIERTPVLSLAATFRDPGEALTFLIANNPDIVFIDIEMPGINGLELARLLHKKPIQVVFCTAYPQYAAKSYDLEATDYLLKPVPYERFLQTILKIQNQHKSLSPDSINSSEKSGTIFIKNGSEIFRLELNKVQYLKKDGHYIVFKLENGEELSRMSMADVLEALPNDNFCRIHKSYVVAMAKIDTISRHSVLVRGHKLPLGESYRKAFLEKIEFSGN